MLVLDFIDIIQRPNYPTKRRKPQSMRAPISIKLKLQPVIWLKSLKPYRFALSLVWLSFLVILFSPYLSDFFRYQASSVSDGQVWRLITANLCHSNWNHWLLNILGLLIMDYFLKPVVSERLRIGILSFTMLGSVLILHLLMDLEWYVGLSGALHGYLFAGAILSWRTDKKINSLILVLISLKVVIENFWEINQSTEKLIGANVVEESHLFGVVSALIFCIGYYLLKKIPPTTRS